MNRNLFVFSLLLVLLGLGLGFTLLAFLGIILMIPSLLSQARPTARTGPAPAPRRQPPRRISPPPVPEQHAPPPPAPARQEASMMTSPVPAAAPSTAYSPALFPSPMFPALSPMGAVAPPAKEPSPHRAEERDELVEVGTILALLKLALG